MKNKEMNYLEYLRSDWWKDLRKKAIERDDNKCGFCGGIFKEVHHIKYPKRFKQDHIDNLICVCKKCHRRLHGINDNSKELFDEIKKRLEQFNQGEYSGILDMSATHDYPMDECRKKNFEFMKNNFGDYLPHITIENFNLFSWKGSIGWVEDNDCDGFGGFLHNCINGNEDNTLKNHSFLNWNSEDIIFWIIKNKWDNK